MRILTPVKRAIDYDVKIRANPDNTGVELTNVPLRTRVVT